MATIPVPPPPPPNTSFKNDDLNAIRNNNTQPPGPEVEAVRLWISLKNEYKSGICCLTPVRPVLQSGPTCGLVALAMAISSLGLPFSVPRILSEAQKQGFSRQGEMMSVHHMKSLCELLFPVTALVTCGMRNNVSRLMDHLSRGWPVILPYDCDANHSPAVRRGMRAHWALIHGFALSSQDSPLTRGDRQPIFWTTPLSADQLKVIHSCSPAHHLFLFARQGKSRFMHLWAFDDLCESNENLLQVSDKLNENSHILPKDGDLSRSLADQFVLIEPKLPQFK